MAPAPAPATELDDLGLGEEGLEFFMSVNSFLIVWYCEEVAEARRAFVSVIWESVVPLLGAALVGPGALGHWRVVKMVPALHGMQVRRERCEHRVVRWRL